MQLVSIAANPVPEGATVGTVKTSDGVVLRFARFDPPAGRKGTLCVFTGRAEFIEKYFEVVRDARARGFAVAMLDWRGQGLSDRALPNARKGHVGNFAEYDRDLEAFVKEIVLPDCPPPLFALAHSMGGAVLIRAAQHGRRWFDRIVVTAPMVGLSGAAGTPFARGTAQAIAFKTMREFADPSYASRLRQPLLLVAAGQDKVVSTAATADFARRLRAGSHLTIPGARHEILMEQDRYREQFWAAFDAFVPGTPMFE